MKALADKITDETFVKGTYEMGDRRCIVGHLRTRYRSPRDRYGGVYDVVVETLAKSIGWAPKQLPIMTAEQYLVYWNDCPSTTAEMVAQACAKAGV